MSTVLQEVRSKAIELRKSRGSKTQIATLTTLLGDANTIEKKFNPAREIRDDEVVALIKSTIKNINGSIEEITSQMGENISESQKEKLSVMRDDAELLEGFLPQQLSEAELRQIIAERVSSGDTLREIMPYLKQNYAGTYDGKMASMIAKELS